MFNSRLVIELILALIATFQVFSKPCSIRPHKSLAPYRDCLGNSRAGGTNSSRGSFDRGDLKEVGGAGGPRYGAPSGLHGFGPGRRHGVAAQQSGEIGRLGREMGERAAWVRRRERCARG